MSSFYEAKGDPWEDRGGDQSATISSGLVERSLDSEASRELKELYGVTRGEADCCGVSLIAIFEKPKGVSLRDAVGTVMEEVGQRDEAVSWELRSGIRVLNSSPQVVSLREFLIPIGDGMEGLKPRFDRLAELVGEDVGASEIRVVYSADLEPAPSVNGRIDIGETPDGRFLIARVFDEGA